MDLAGPVFQQPAEGDFGQLFAEELGLVLEVAQQDEQHVVQAYQQAGLSAQSLGTVSDSDDISIRLHGRQHIAGDCVKCLPAHQGDYCTKAL